MWIYRFTRCIALVGNNFSSLSKRWYLECDQRVALQESWLRSSLSQIRIDVLDHTTTEEIELNIRGRLAHMLAFFWKHSSEDFVVARNIGQILEIRIFPCGDHMHVFVLQKHKRPFPLRSPLWGHSQSRIPSASRFPATPLQIRLNKCSRLTSLGSRCRLPNSYTGIQTPGLLIVCRTLICIILRTKQGDSGGMLTRF